MIKKIKAFIAVAVLSGTVGANVHAAELTVKEGDNLWDLSQLHNTTVENIEKWNHLTTDLIHPGDVLQIATEIQYTVQQDDTLSFVAMKYQVTVNQIKEWNKLNTDLIHPGLTLIIYDELNNHAESAGDAINSSNNTSEKASVEATSEPEKMVNESANSATNNAGNVSEATNNEAENSKEFTVNATAYTASCEGCSGTTATGVDLSANPDAKVIAVDPSVIPLGSKVYVEGYGEAIAADTGGAIKGNRIDVFIPSKQDAINWGRKQVTVKILNE
ncbi:MULTISPECIES: LysM peptidoglycan-binding and 3D domain-containing protein [Bacillaceae]|uniref:LysM peptidoglycan-binding and 3D domain-containing protein n=1 Tax=Bacillaceae TaxID=186817 RepID=UPI001188B903|nr:3D domain-containing protein [Bacillus sp. S3]QCJ43071.1 LysM peptidoglycan-binding domain-containing protein [Bacillus sp. S3]